MSKNINDTELLEHLVESKINFIKEISKTVIGQKDILDQMLIALLTRAVLASISITRRVTRTSCAIVKIASLVTASLI